ncbi:hypothetical protein AYI70_g3457 [Smittium culicis]|uniref:CCHC-type domain-containing protein n=2 Tax=Smittium culicis TaxID=133412 RepID=A0A1R1Y3L3_9FUNG|nr:hypothetical protein AYI70_g3457 [Smittium culicis]
MPKQLIIQYQAQSSPGLSTWRSHLGTVTNAVPTGMYHIMLPKSRFRTTWKTSSMSCRPARVLNAHEFENWIFFSVCKTKVENLREIPVQYKDCGIAHGYQNETKMYSKYMELALAYETQEECYDVFSAYIFKEDPSHTELNISEVSTTGVIQKHTGLEEVIRNLKRLSISDPDRKGVPEDWVKQPPPIFSGKWDENVLTFMKTFTVHVGSMGLNLESSELLSYFKEYLNGEALRVAGPLAVIYPEWPDFVEKFSERFNGKERVKNAKKELLKLDLYGDEALFVFAKLKSIFEAMDLIEESEKTDEILKKCSIADRNRILDKGLTKFSEVLEYFLTEEERRKKFEKVKKDHNKTFKPKSIEKSAQPSRHQIKLVSPPASKDLSKIKCFRCESYGHYARDCSEYPNKSDQKTVEDQTPVQGNPKLRRIPFSTGVDAPENKRLDFRKTPTPIRRILGKKEDVNLVDLKSQTKNKECVTAVTGVVEINGKAVKFQYDSGASVNIISDDLANSLDIGPVMKCDVKVMPINGISQSVKYVPSVNLRFGDFECTTEVHVMKTKKKNLLLLGIGFFAKIGAEVSLRYKIMTIETENNTYKIPLKLETRNIDSEIVKPDVHSLEKKVLPTKFHDVENQILSSKKKTELLNLLNQFEDSFAEKLEDLRGAKVEAFGQDITRGSYRTD